MNAAHLIWSALWRAQVSHLAVFVVVPLVAAVVRAAIGVILLPFLLGGFGDGSVAHGAQVSHLRDPACWLMLAPCGVADRSVAPMPFQTVVLQSGMQVDQFLPMPIDLTVRHVWFVLWLAWFVAHLVRRERRSRTASRAPGKASP